MSIDNNLISLFKQKKFKEFIIHAEKNYLDHPDNIDLIILISISYAECNNFAKARDFINKGYMLDSANENVLYNFAKISEELGNQKEAEDLYDQLLEINPRRTDALNNLARLKNKDLSESWMISPPSPPIEERWMPHAKAPRRKNSMDTR